MRTETEGDFSGIIYTEWWGFLFILLYLLAPIILTLLITFMVFRHKRRRFQFQQEKAELREANERELLRAQMEIQNQTLRQVGEDLHDDVGQLLTVARLELNSLEEVDLSPPVIRANEVLQTAIQAIRALSKTLDSETIVTFRLEESLGLEVERIRRMGRFAIDLTLRGTPRPLPQNGQVVLFRMMQELLNNAMKHSGGSRIDVTLHYEPAGVRATVADDGRGFDPAEVTERPLHESGSGLRHLHRRCELLGGTCQVRSAPGAGTEIAVYVPLL